MQMRKRKLALAAVLTLCMMLPLAALAQTQYVTWESDPKENSNVETGDTIRYTITLEEAAKKEDWTALRVQLGTGLTLQPDSIALSFAQLPAASESPNSTKPSETPQPEAKDVQWEIVPGNDGFVLLVSALSSGDTVSFSAIVQEKGNINVTVRTDSFSSEISHKLVMQPTPAPTLISTPASIAVQEPRPLALHIALAVLILPVLTLLGIVGYKKFIELKSAIKTSGQDAEKPTTPNAPEE